MKRGRNSILALAVISEGFLVLLAYLIAWGASLPLEWHPSLRMMLVGCASTAPLLFGNELLWNWSKRHPRSVYHRFSAEIVVPLCREIRPAHIPVVALLSGVGEEALFRGALNSVLLAHTSSWIALVVTSVAFAYVHFIGSVGRFGGMIPLYTLVGGALWFVWYYTDSLAAAATTHAVYNFVAISWIKYRSRRGA